MFRFFQEILIELEADDLPANDLPADDRSANGLVLIDTRNRWEDVIEKAQTHDLLRTVKEKGGRKEVHDGKSQIH